MENAYSLPGDEDYQLDDPNIMLIDISPISVYSMGEQLLNLTLGKDFESIEDYHEDSSICSGLSYLNISSSHKRSIGRSKNHFTLILDNFYTSAARHPKKEFFNVFMIRAIKRAIRYISQGKVPKNTAIAVDVTKDNEIEIWQRIKVVYKADPGRLLTLANTSCGPETDGRSKRNKKKGKSVFKSFNNEYCKLFFLDERMRKIFHLLIDLIFCDLSPARLKSKLKFNCCTYDEHGQHCYEIWEEFKEYLKHNYFIDLEVIESDAMSRNSAELP